MAYILFRLPQLLSHAPDLNSVQTCFNLSSISFYYYYVLVGEEGFPVHA